MSDRFYNQMLKTTGSCPGFIGRRKTLSEWTPELKEEVIAAYKDREPTPENSMDIVNELAEDFEKSPNGIRVILSKAGAYVKKTSTAKAASGTTGGSRVSKAAAQESLTQAITDAGQDADAEIISRMTGKAAVYFAALIAAINE